MIRENAGFKSRAPLEPTTVLTSVMCTARPEREDKEMFQWTNTYGMAITECQALGDKEMNKRESPFSQGARKETWQ